MNNYQATVTHVQDLLANHQEWKERYKKYIDVINKKSENDTFKGARERFYVPAPFHLYMPLSMAVNECSDKYTVFDLRFHGRSVANLLINHDEDKSVILKVKKPKAVCKALRLVGRNKDADTLEKFAEKIDWNSQDARNFRKIYATLEVCIKDNVKKYLPGQPEHDLESELLQNYSQKSSEGKEVSYIQPVTMMGSNARFQMPTPIKASSVKKGIEQLEHSVKGGGIDILARMGSGRNAVLAIIELKDENTVSESPEKAICQAIAYASFIHELLRSESGQKWWNFFGFGGCIPNKLTIRAIIEMPYKNIKGCVDQHTLDFIDSMKDSETKYIQITGDHEDRLELGYIFREEGKDSIKSF